MKTIAIIFVPIILIFAIALLTILVPLPRPFPEARSSGRNQFAAILTGILGILYVIGVAVHIISLVSGAGRMLDDIFLARKLTPKNYMKVGREFHGNYKGRQTDIYYMPAHRLKFAVIDMHVATKFDAKIAIIRKKPLLDCTNCPEVGIENFPFRVFSENPDLAVNFLNKTQNRELIYKLLDEDPGIIRELYIKPEEVWFRAHFPPQLPKKQIELWFEETLQLAGLLEAQ